MSLSIYLWLAVCCLSINWWAEGCEDWSELPHTINPTLKNLMKHNLASGECDGIGQPFNSISLYSRRNRILHFARVDKSLAEPAGYCTVDFQYSDTHLKFHSRIFACFDKDQDSVFYGYPDRFLNWLDSMGICDGACTIGAKKEEYIKQFSAELSMSRHQGYASLHKHQIKAYINRMIFWLKTIDERKVVFEFFQSNDSTAFIFGLNMTRTLGYNDPIFEMEQVAVEKMDIDITPQIKTILVIPWLDAEITYNMSHEDGDITVKKTVAAVRIADKPIFKSIHTFHFFKLLLQSYSDQVSNPLAYSVDYRNLPKEDVFETEIQITNDTFSLRNDDNFDFNSIAVEKVVNKIYKDSRHGAQSHIWNYNHSMTLTKSPELNNKLTVLKQWNTEGIETNAAWIFSSSSFHWSHFVPDRKTSVLYRDLIRTKLTGHMELKLPLDFVFSSFVLGYGYDEEDFFRIAFNFPTSEDKLHFTLKVKFIKQDRSNEWVIILKRGNIWSLSEEQQLLVIEVVRLKNKKAYHLHEIIATTRGDREYIEKYLSLCTSSLEEALTYVKEKRIIDLFLNTFRDIFGQSLKSMVKKMPTSIRTFGDMLDSFAETIGLRMITEFDRYAEFASNFETKANNFLKDVADDIQSSGDSYSARFYINALHRELLEFIVTTLTTLLPGLDMESFTSFLQSVKYEWMEKLEDWLFS